MQTIGTDTYKQPSQSTTTILIVDDDATNLATLGSLLLPHFQVLAAPSGERALQIAKNPTKPDLILLDVMMPDMNGYEVLVKLRNQPATRDIPVIFVTGLDSCEDEEHGLALGAVDYITKPYRPSIVLARLHTHLELKKVRDQLANQNARLETEVAARTHEIQLIQNVTIKALAELAETRDSDTGYHIHRTQEYISILAQHLKTHPRFSDFLTDNTLDSLVKSAPLHDIGKVGIPDHILLKPDKLNNEEWEVMKTHTLLGAQAIERAVRDAGRSFEFLEIAKQIAHFHHEKWDGTGYPNGLKGSQIPIPARLMAVADVFDALISPRVYKVAMPFEQAKNLIVEGRGRHFDPDITDAFEAVFDDFVSVAQKYHNGIHHA